jgi:hypothetical protein
MEKVKKKKERKIFKKKKNEKITENYIKIK